MPTENISHDALQAKCFTWLWNTYDRAKYCCWANNGNGARNALEGSLNIARGHYKGVVDHFIYNKGQLYILEFKVGKDYLKPKQRRFKAAMQREGAIFYQVPDFETYQRYAENIFAGEVTVTKKR